MFQWLKKKEESIHAPVVGRCISLDDVSDPVFSQHMMGDGVAFQFEGDTLYSPCAGKVLVVADTCHAIGLQTKSGAQLMLHIGLDTVYLKGEGMEAKVKPGDSVCVGQPLIVLDRSFINEKHVDLTTPLVLTNGDAFKLSLQAPSEVTLDSVVMTAVKI
jgi:glucose-specific phosphotransferase system IIA component